MLFIKDMIVNLTQFQVGQSGRIKSYLSGISGYRQKLLALGLVPGTRFKVIRVAPLGDPLELRVRNFSLSLRKEESNILDVELLHDSN
jgi:Fe2+ transport system protein FeoA